MESEDLIIDIRSIERAEKLIRFIDKYIPRKAAKITHAAIYNKIVTKKDLGNMTDINYDEIFSKENITIIDPEKDLALLNRSLEKIEAESKKTLPMVEKLPVHYYEDGIDGFALACKMRQMIAMEHLSGNKDCSFYDLMEKLFNKSDKDQLEVEQIH